jgi:16S rRNA U516 pseudouridylate synthase RsuA-like enzyme
VAFGGVELGTLPAGRWRELDAVEIASLVRVAAAGCR